MDKAHFDRKNKEVAKDQQKETNPNKKKLNKIM